MTQSNLIATTQQQEIGASIVELFELYLFNDTSLSFFFFNGLDEGIKNVYFPTANGTSLKEYIAIPLEFEGTSFSSTGALPRPKLRIANLVSIARTLVNDSTANQNETTLSTLFETHGINGNNDLLQSRIVVRRTLSTYLYNSTQVSGFTTTAPVEFPSQSYVLDRVASEHSVGVEFELASVFDLENVKVPNRQIIGKYCPWEYQASHLRGVGGCNWSLEGDQSGARFFDINDKLIDLSAGGRSTSGAGAVIAWANNIAYSTGDKVKVTTTVPNTRIKATSATTVNYVRIYEALFTNTNKNPTTTSGFWKRIDLCGKLLKSCKIRFQGEGTNYDTSGNLADLNTRTILPFGGFPGTDKFK